MTERTRRFPPIFAAVDLGSNSFHLLVARTDGRALAVVDRLREMVQLGAGLDRSGRLTRAARARALDCLRRFGQRLRHMPTEAVRAVGTNTLRTARDARRFLAEAERALGHPIETISGIEEARLIFLGVTQTLPEPGRKRLVVDIGGGSTELIVGAALEPQLLESLYMGSITVSRAHFADGNLSAVNWRRAETAALQELEPISGKFQSEGWEEAVGASGTIHAVDDLLRIYGFSKDGITPQALARLRDRLLAAGKVSRLELAGLDPQRRPFFAGGVVVLSAILGALGIERLRRSDGALREGLLYDLVGRVRDNDARSRSVEALASRFHVDRKQASRVEATSLELLSHAAGPWRLEAPGLRVLLSWASRLHEIGLDIAHDHHHRHAEYIVARSDMPGFSRTEQRQLATLVRAHRRKFPLAAIAALPRSAQRGIERLAILLRLAVVLHRSRSPQADPELALSVSKKSMRLQVPRGWLAEHPLTRADLETEARYLAAAGFRLRVEARVTARRRRPARIAG